MLSLALSVFFSMIVEDRLLGSDGLGCGKIHRGSLTLNGDPVGMSRTVTKTIDQKQNPTLIIVVGNEERPFAWDAP